MKHEISAIAFSLVFGLPVYAAEFIDNDPAAWEFTDGSITFFCIGPDGTPLPDAQVDFVEWDYFMPPLTADVERARTDHEGKCTFLNLTGGSSHAVHATKDGWGCWVAKSFLKPSVKHPTVTLTLGVFREICGVVLDRTGAPISGVQILDRGVLPGAVTDERGAFCIANLQDQQEFSFYKAGYGWINSGLAGPVAVLEITLPEGGVVEAIVLDAADRPVPGAKVTYVGGNQYYGARARATQVADEQGKITTVWIPSDRDISVSASYERDGYLWRDEREVRPTAGKTISITLRPTARSKIVEDGNRYIPLQDRPKGVVTGKVVMEGTEKPVLAGILYDTSQEWVRSVEAITEDDGTFRCEGLALGTYYFTAFPRTASLYHKGGLVQVELNESQPSRELTFTVAEGCAIRGDVKSADGLPVPSAQISYSPANPNHYHPVVTDAMGHFFIPHLAFPDRSYKLTVHSNHGKPATVEIGPVGRGTISEPLLVTLEDVYLAPATAGKLHGQVIDQNGEPVRGATVSFSSDIAPEPTETDQDGRFTLELRQGGEGSFSVRYNSTILVNGMVESIWEPLEIMEGISVAIRDTEEIPFHTIRAEVPAWKYVGGFVTDTEGNPLSPDVWVYAEDCMGTGHAENGAFLRAGCSKPFEKDPVLLEFRLEGYRARVLESGRDFELGDTRVRVVMKKGPYEPFESIFEAVTGRPASQVNEMFRGDRILENTIEYWQLAQSSDSGRRYGEPPNWVIVKDENGEPVTRILLRSPFGNRPIILSTGEESDYPPESLEDGQGRYELPDKARFVWAEGMGMAYLVPRSREHGAEPRVVVLHPAAEIIVKAVDATGQPVSNVTISIDSTSKIWPQYIHTSPPQPTTDKSGILRFAHLAPGEYKVWAFKKGYDPARATISVNSGDVKTVELNPVTKAISMSPVELDFRHVAG
jgi:hypothetical protein